MTAEPEATPLPRWIRAYEQGGDYIEHRDGIPWHDARVPPRWHCCKPQTRGWLDRDYVERCPCGATRLHASGPWIRKNETRRGRARQRRDARAPKETVTCSECGKPYEAVARSAQARQRLCTSCWADRFVREAGYR